MYTIKLKKASSRSLQDENFVNLSLQQKKIHVIEQNHHKYISKSLISLVCVHIF